MMNPDRSGITVSTRSYTTLWDPIHNDYVVKVCPGFQVRTVLKPG